MSEDVVERRPIPPIGQRVDIETLVGWAIGQTGYLPWSGVSDKELAMDHGWTAIPKGVSREYHARELLLRCKGGIPFDAMTIVEAVKALEPSIASMVIACARKAIRPDWCRDIVPRQVPKTVSWRSKSKKKKKGHRSHTTLVWTPCSPEAICAARDAYQRWHQGMAGLATALAGVLKHWQTIGFSAPRAPWEQEVEKAA